MPSNTYPTPRLFPGVMVSSTFTDLEHHREALGNAINSQSLHEIAMENDSAKPFDIIDSSLSMVRDASAYIGVIGHKYGQTPLCPQRNPDQLSITELEFNEAQLLGRTILIFIMGDAHQVVKADVEIDPIKQQKLDAFRERAKQMRPDSEVHRVYATFNSLEEFATKAIQAAAELRRHLDETKLLPTKLQIAVQAPIGPKSDPTPTPPAFYAEPPYIGSHKFVGRQAQLETLNDWAIPADSHPVLLFEAIGGTGKSILTWEWTKKHSSKLRDDWAGRFWYSFYEKGATMLDFCRRALAYMTGQRRGSFREKNTAELTKLLIHQLQARPWLFILDGLERVLVSYHRFDAAQVRDEDAGLTDIIAHRDPCAAINPEDDDLLRAIAGASPSKLLLTSRLIPRALLNNSNQPIPGVLRENLPGLRPSDAEFLFRSCGVTGTALNIQNYLKSHCDCHPLVIGVLAGLINDYLPDRGNFDAWAADPVGGGQLNFANLDLVKKRNHILTTALAALPDASRQLLSTLALLSGSVDYTTLCAFSPHLTPIPEEVQIPKKNPESKPSFRKLPEAEQARIREEYRNIILCRKEFEQALVKREEEMRTTAKDLAATVKDLEHRGLLQYDPGTKHYDLHPVVRGISASGLRPEEMHRYGQRVLDHFSQRSQDPYDQAESLEVFDNARHVVKAYFQMGKLADARQFVLQSTFLQELNSRFEAHNDILSIIKPFFPDGWKFMPAYLQIIGGIRLAKYASVALRRIGALQDAFDISETAILVILKQNSTQNLLSLLVNLASTAGEQNKLALEDRLLHMANQLVFYKGVESEFTTLHLALFRQLSRLGKRSESLKVWSQLTEYQLTATARSIAEHHYAVHRFSFDELTEEELVNAEEVNRNSALGKRNLCALRGFWCLEHNDFENARKSLHDAVALAHKAGKVDRRSEICLALAKCKLDVLTDKQQSAEQFTYDLDESSNKALADLWFAIGDLPQAKKHAIAAYKWASADGEPYVRRKELTNVSALLEKLGVEPPKLPPYDPSRDRRLPWEEKVTTTIEKLRTELDANKLETLRVSEELVF